MNNIDKGALREAADSVIQKYGSEWFETGRQLCTVHKSKIELIAAANPATVLALLDELEVAEKRIAELEARSIGEHDLFLRAKALMYQSGGAPVEKSLNPVDAWLFDAEQATTKAPVLPPLNDDIVSILGRPNFMCSQFAEFLRMDGMEIRRKSEHEQAAVIHWFMNLYLQHGAGWGNVARAELERINRAAGIGVKGE